mmetsp:Transcript_108622/g.315931  ORF Transcript_108622/g.315931 Transcript_108622/m.315931 type:complete len:335 (+) Transcript_108622:373-1377(+)
MIFHPLKYWSCPGLGIKAPAEGSPFGLVGWQGIVPSKVKKMGTRIVQVVPIVEAELTGPQYVREQLADMLITTERIEALVADVITCVQDDVDSYLDVEGAVVSSLGKDVGLLVNLFERCGAPELRFLVMFGLWGGLGLGVFQMLLWLVWSPAWSLPATGALVGLITDWVALRLMFTPVQPVNILGRFKIQGLFLQRQREVASDFGEFFAKKILTPERIWDDIIRGNKSAALTALLESRIRAAVSPLEGALTDDFFATVSNRVQRALPEVVPSSYAYVEKTLALEGDLTSAMRSMPSEDFEEVLHPVFQEDEWILCLLGAVLGGLAGAAQVPFYR